MIDQWCEQRMWKSMQIYLGRTEPICAITGLSFIIVPLLSMPEKCCATLVLLQVCLMFLSFGTIIFHAIPETQLSRNVHVNDLDWFPITICCSVLLYIYLLPALKVMSYAAIFAALSAFGAWVVLLEFGRDFVSPAMLNAALLLPLFVVLASYTATVFREKCNTVWFYLLVSLVIWLFNVVGCEYDRSVALLHPLYHFTIAKGMWEAGKLGLTLAH